MGIIIKWAELSKGYYYGEFLQHKPGLGAEVTGDTTDDEALDILEKMLDRWHIKKTVGTPFESLKAQTTITSSISEIPTINKDFERMEIEIDNCSTKEELTAWNKRHDILPGKMLTYYTERLKILSNGH